MGARPRIPGLDGGVPEVALETMVGVFGFVVTEGSKDAELLVGDSVGTITTVLPIEDDDGNGVGVGAELNCAYADVLLAPHAICVAKNSDAPDLLMPDKKTDTSRK